MENLQEMTIEQLNDLITAAQSEIQNRTGFDYEFDVRGKAVKGCTYAQIQLAEKLAEKTGSEIKVNSSQLQKRFEMEDMSEAIDMMKEGKKIQIADKWLEIIKSFVS